ncbi:sterol-binding protein [Actinoplanes hulinensis]|uniref:Sterol-binding protein n=1 Tax=Actinoplanes hulinensis TaxID=1144547 RepID=A0ABS7B5S5_9ACTN|nr:sterol-binding protein [Actinoplanes hulinensis]MBW6436252.1 sterol-binding protein [Actinoplanes hulinensis]
MATVEECRQALNDLATRLAANAEAQGKLDLDRTLACRLTDLGAAFHGRITGGRLVDITDGDDPKAKIALVITSDDLIDLVNGRLELTRVISSIRANPFDLLKLRKLL